MTTAEMATFGIEMLGKIAQATIDQRNAEIKMLKSEIRQAYTIIERYSTRVPLGHQPHMTAHVADAWLKANKEISKGTP